MKASVHCFQTPSVATKKSKIVLILKCLWPVLIVLSALWKVHLIVKCSETSEWCILELVHSCPFGWTLCKFPSMCHSYPSDRQFPLLFHNDFCPNSIFTDLSPRIPIIWYCYSEDGSLIFLYLILSNFQFFYFCSAFQEFNSH